MHELERVLERQVRELAGGVQPERSALDRPAEAEVGMLLRGHERMFSSSSSWHKSFLSEP